MKIRVFGDDDIVGWVRLDPDDKGRPGDTICDPPLGTLERWDRTLAAWRDVQNDIASYVQLYQSRHGQR